MIRWHFEKYTKLSESIHYTFKGAISITSNLDRCVKTKPIGRFYFTDISIKSK